MSSKTKKIDQDAADMFISELEKAESLQNVISESCKNIVAKNEGFRRLKVIWNVWLRQEFSI